MENPTNPTQVTQEADAWKTQQQESQEKSQENWKTRENQQTPGNAASAESTSTRELGIQETAQRREPVMREARSGRRDEGIIYVGKKPLMTYVLAVVTQFNAGQNSVKIKGRGKVISRVIDVTQVVKNRFVNSLRITNFDASTEMLPNEDGTTSKVSSLTLTLTK